MAQRWTKEQDKYLSDNYPSKRIQEVCEYLGFNRQRIHDRAVRLGIKKVKFFNTPTAKSKETQFKKGISSWNKGIFGLRMSPATEFKKGCEPHNKLPEELKEISLLRQRLSKNVNERIKRYAKKQDTRP
jgi:hypothetical protein